MTATQEPPALPPAVRDRVVALAAACLAGLTAEEAPLSLRPFRQFARAKLARLAAGQLALAVDTDVAFRARVADALRAAHPTLAAALDAGDALPAADPAEVAAAAYLLRSEGWTDRVLRAAREGREREPDGPPAEAAVAARAAEEARAARRVERDRSRLDGARVREETAALRAAAKDAGARAARAEAATRAAAAEAARWREAAERAEAARERDARALRTQKSRLEAAEAAAAATATAGSTSAAAARHDADLRLRVLLDALLGAAQGIRRELALPPADQRPADAVAARLAAAPGGVAGGAGGAAAAAGPATQGRDDDDPALLAAWLSVPGTHLLVDGYNVTKAGYGGLTLEAQRGRLLTGLAALAARTHAETTVVFDGTDRPGPLAAPAPRGVRLLFSPTGVIADDVLRELVRAEPPGRPLLVVSSDREVADGVRADGARAVPSRALLRLLDRA